MMNVRRGRVWPCACLALAALAGGCAAPLATTYLSGSRRTEARLAKSNADDAADELTAAALRKANGQQPKTPEEALAGVLEELQEIHAIDPAAQQQVLADLKGAKPEHYALIVEQFHRALAYREQLARREAAELLASTQVATDAEPATVTVTARPAPPTAIAANAPPTAPTVQVVADPMPTARPVEQSPVATALAAASDRGDAQLQQATATTPAMASNTAPATAGDWQRELDLAIEDLRRKAPAQPATIEEMHEHLRLRTLLLIAGRDEEAYQPIPGASPAQQDYWSKQLFAMGAYLNDAATVNDKQRAAGALVHLDEARAALAELATLQIRNMAFVERVDGFGAYAPLKSAKFEPGAAVTVYAEVENFSSTPTPEGFETVLATSYQVVDASGRRIEGAQFPDVSDVCRGRRRDFHLQYGVSLPTRISPGEYRLELTITDQRSGKIGHGSAPFEINAEQ